MISTSFHVTFSTFPPRIPPPVPIFSTDSIFLPDSTSPSITLDVAIAVVVAVVVVTALLLPAAELVVVVAGAVSGAQVGLWMTTTP